MRIAILNQHTQNFGDEAAGSALIGMLLSNSDVHAVDVIYNGPGALPIGDSRVRRVEGAELKEIGYLNLGIAFFFKRFRGIGRGGRALRVFAECIDQADFVLVAPSGANIGIYRDWRFLFRLLLAIRRGAHPVFFWNTIGASGSRIFDRIAHGLLSQSHLYVRERASQAYLESIGLPAKLGPDTAFALPPLELKVRPLVVSWVPSELDSWHPAFRDFSGNQRVLGTVTSQIAAFVLANDLRIDLLPHLGTENERNFNLLVRDALLCAGVPSHALTVVPELSTFAEYDQALAGSRLVIGGRYHTAVLAAKNFRPFVALSYENKMAEVCEYTSMQDFCIDLTSEASISHLASALDRALSSGAEISAMLQAIVPAQILPVVPLPLRDLGFPTPLLGAS